jgi:hypothetical protein
VRKALVALLATALLAGAAMTTASSPGVADTSDKPVLTIDFSDYDAEKGSVRDWLAAKGFNFKFDSEDHDDIALSAEQGGLHIRTNKPAFGMIYRELDAPGAARARITWGVSEFPEGASYENGVHDEALMLYIFLGDEKMPSGSWLLPDSPYFIGMYLCDSDQVERPYQGKYYKGSGRFVCVGKPGRGEKVVSEFDFATAFEKYFGKDQVPVVSGIGLEVDTKEAGNDGRAAAFIQKIELLD